MIPLRFLPAIVWNSDYGIARIKLFHFWAAIGAFYINGRFLDRLYFSLPISKKLWYIFVNTPNVIQEGCIKWRTFFTRRHFLYMVFASTDFKQIHFWMRKESTWGNCYCIHIAPHFRHLGISCYWHLVLFELILIYVTKYDY